MFAKLRYTKLLMQKKAFYTHKVAVKTSQIGNDLRYVRWKWHLYNL